MGIVGPTKERIALDAARLNVPVLFLLQWHDELFARDYGLALFDALASTDKRLHVNPGAHGAIPPDQFDLTEQFLAARLSALAREGAPA
jgi:hypothetical protein